MSAETLTPAQRDDLRVIAAMIIPESAEYRVPGADDTRIQADIASSISRDATSVHKCLALLDRLAGGDFAALPEARQDEVCEARRAEGGVDLMLTTRIVLGCYYRDDRVMISLGMEPRAPFPKGHDLPQGDWALLDPVRKRGKIWRET